MNNNNDNLNSIQNFKTYLLDNIKNKNENSNEILQINQLTPIENNKSPVIYVRGIDNNKVNSTILLNLFSNFGSITKILILKLKSVALIEYESKEYAGQAKNFLNNTIFLGVQLKVKPFLFKFIIFILK